MNKGDSMENFVKEYLQEGSAVVAGLDANAITQAIALIDEARNNDKNVFVIGNGGSASTAEHFAGDLFKWATGNGLKRIKAHHLLSNIPAVTALVNDEGWDQVYLEQLKSYAGEGDLIIGFSVHGGSGSENAGEWSQNMPMAIDYIHKKGGKSIGITGFDGGLMGKMCTVNVNVPVESTPHVEGTHLVVSHLIADGLRKLAVPKEEHLVVRQ
jgi:D-sedoheptulose 7-phosphate isomerase